jgi:hypothetical protein
VGVYTPLGKVARILWLRCVVAYTVAGCISSAIVGMFLGTIGHVIPERYRELLFYPVALLGLVLSARELGWISFWLPERKCQTEKYWIHEFSPVTTSIMWGLHIGLGFATRVTYGGFWLIVAVIIALGTSNAGSVLMLAYWAGRSLSVWLSPVLVRTIPEGMGLLDIISEGEATYHRLAAVCLASSAFVACLLAVRTLQHE